MRIRDLLDRTHLDALLTELTGPPVGSGNSARWHCCERNHADEHPSVTIARDRNGTERWRCWSGGHGGTAVDAIMAANGVSLPEAMRLLEQRLAPEPPARSSASRPRPTMRSALSAEAREYALACAELLWTPVGREALAWLHRRGLTDEVLRLNLVGFDPGVRLLDRAAGLARTGGVTYCAFDRGDDLVYVQTRHLDPDSPIKYSNPARSHGPAPVVSHPRAPGECRGPVIVTEGIADGLAAAVAGRRAVAVTSATANARRVADELVLRIGAVGVVLAFDGDAAGRRAQLEIAEHVGGRIPLTVLHLAEGHDLTDTYRRDRPWQPTPNFSAAASIA